MQLSPFDWVAIACFLIAALVMAINQAAKDSAVIRRWFRETFSAPSWSVVNYLPLILMLVGIGIALRRVIPSTTQPDFPSGSTSPKTLETLPNRPTQQTSPAAPPSASPASEPKTNDTRSAEATVSQSAGTPTATLTPEVKLVPNAFISEDDQAYIGAEIQKRRYLSGCIAQIIRCPTAICEDDGRAMSAAIARAGWSQPNPPTSHGWRRFKESLTVHSKVGDDCAVALVNRLHEIGVVVVPWIDPGMRKENRVEVIIRDREK